MNYAFINTEVVGAGKNVMLVTLNRPQQLNALCDQMINEICDLLSSVEADDFISAVVITGSEKAFAAGADIAAMKDFTYVQTYRDDYITRNWDAIKRFRKPLIAAVAGYALGGGCELAMTCDFIIAAENACFGQPEIKLGVLPGAGGTQRLPRAIGKAKAMDMCLTGRYMDAQEAERSGLVTRIVPTSKIIDEAVAAAEQIAKFSAPVVMMIKENINRAFESSLNEGLLFERRTFHATFGLNDRREGMTAFLEKRQPSFKNT